MEAKERSLFGEGGEVKKNLSRELERLANEEYLKLLPAYVRGFLIDALPLLDIGCEGDVNDEFAIYAMKPRALDRLLPVLETYPAESRERLTANRPIGERSALFLRPGEPLFDRICDMLEDRYASDAQKGALFIDPTAKNPYLFHLVKINVIRNVDPSYVGLAHPLVIEEKLLGIRQDEGGLLFRSSSGASVAPARWRGLVNERLGPNDEGRGLGQVSGGIHPGRGSQERWSRTPRPSQGGYQNERGVRAQGVRPPGC